ncbi:MAG: TetR/AcrR family transcriptional regulator [Alphaproteobacteria bacterium]|nr:TetR/AcrR family transcriptional regulator [Alphaproteobacteria bacterium]MCB9696636.1 TetR/AcrR family transcriptional regulator [Alphaproteobacteria bacterium]
MTEARRGRPRSYDPDEALDAAIDVFWTHGYDAATLDQLSQAMGMGRPSLYGAFGDKQALFERAVRRFGERMATRAGRALSAPRIEDAVRAVLLEVIEVYGGSGRGCLVFGVAPARAVDDPSVREMLASTITSLDTALRARLDRAVADGELPAGTDTAARARLLAATIHSLSVRARAGLPTSHLQQLAEDAVELVRR